MDFKMMLNKKLIFIYSFVILTYVLLFYFSMGFMVWFAVVPLLLLAYEKSFKEILAPAIVVSIIISILYGQGIMHFSMFYSIVAILHIASFFLIFIYLFNLISRKIKYPFIIIVPPILWSLLQFLYSFTFGGSYWFNLGYFQPMMAPLIWFINGFGITFLIILMNSLIAFYILKRSKKLLIIAIILSVVLGSCFIYSYTAETSGTNLKVALIQGNIPKFWQLHLSDSDIYNIYENLSIEVSQYKPDLIIWPEYSIPDDVLANKELFNKISNLARKVNSTLVFGAQIEVEPGLDFGRTSIDQSPIKITNSALVFSNDGTFLGRHDSVKTFPFNLGSVDVINGKNYTLFDTDSGNFGISMCYEEVVNSGFREYADANVDFIISISNNVVIKERYGIYIKSLFPRLRAAENKKYVLASTNTGITQVINPYGKVVAKLEPNIRGYLIADIFIDNNKQK